MTSFLIVFFFSEDGEKVVNPDLSRTPRAMSFILTQVYRMFKCLWMDTFLKLIFSNSEASFCYKPEHSTKCWMKSTQYHASMVSFIRLYNHV